MIDACSPFGTIVIFQTPGTSKKMCIRDEMGGGSDASGLDWQGGR